MPTLWQSIHSYVCSRLPMRNTYPSPLWAVRSYHSLHTMEVWSCATSTVAMAMGTAASQILKQLFQRSVIKQSFHIKHILWLGWHWKGAKKWKMPETTISTNGGHGHTFRDRDFVHKQTHVWYTEMLIYLTVIINNQMRFSLNNVSLMAHVYQDVSSQSKSSFSFQIYHCNHHSLSYRWV